MTLMLGNENLNKAGRARFDCRAVHVSLFSLPNQPKRNDKNLEELADLLEVLYTAAIARGYTIDELEALRLQKREKRGGFDKKILLKSVVEE